MNKYGRLVLLLLGLGAVIAGVGGRFRSEARPAPAIGADGVVAEVEVRAVAPGSAAAWRVSADLN